MSEVPKPLPRTKLRPRPVRIIHQEPYDIRSDPNSKDPSSLNVSSQVKQSEHFSNNGELILNDHHDEQPAASNDITEIRLVNERFDATDESSKEPIVSEQDTKPDSAEHVRSPSCSRPENGNTSNQKDDDRYSEVYSKDNDDDDDDVVNEFLKYKKGSRDKKLLENGNMKSADTISEETVEKAVSSRTKNVDVDTITEGNEDDLLGIHVHRSDCLKMDRIIRHPSVILHIVDADNKGVYLQKSKPTKNVTFNQEQSSFILPVMTRPFNFKDNKSILPQWEEMLTFNESTSYIIKPSTIFFFEIVDFIDSCNSDADYASIGWHHIAWAFLKPVGKNNTLNVGKMLRLQLYYGDQKTTSITNSNIPCVYGWYRRKRWNQYPSTLYVTVKIISSSKVNTKPQQRSCTPFQPEVGSDASVKSLALFSLEDDSSDTKNTENLSAIYRLSNIEWNRLPGQSCRIPNTKIATLYPDPKGCLALKFSNSGIFLACGTSNDVFIYAVDGVLERRLINHMGLIYTLCWFTDDSLLLSASADCTACIWDMKSSNEHPLQILPHPSFVYCSTFVFPEQTVVTGCYDGIVRIWWQTHASSRHWQLHQELSGHEEYVSSLCSFKNKEFFSGDSNGIIIHWTSDEFGRWFKLNVIKLTEIQYTIINKLTVFPGYKRLLIHTRDSLLRTMDIKTSVIIQWYQGGLNDSSQSNSVITPCGSLVLASSEDATVNVWESNTGKHIAFYSSGSVTAGCGGTVDFHPLDHIAAFSFYSVGGNSSSVNLLKYSANVIKNSEVMLYMLNELAVSPYEASHLAQSNSGKEYDPENYGKHTLQRSTCISNTTKK